MEKNMFDEALDGAGAIVNELSDALAGMFRKSNPFDKEEVSLKEQLYLFETDGENTFKQIADEQGLEAGERWIQQMEQARGKLNGRRTEIK